MINMSIEDKCKLICAGIEDERKSQSYYKKLMELFPNNDLISHAHTDEVEHEDLLTELKIENNCDCEKELKILILREISKLPKKERIELAKRIWKE